MPLAPAQARNIIFCAAAVCATAAAGVTTYALQPAAGELIPLEFKTSFETIVEDMKNMCAPSQNLPAGAMRVTVYEYSAKLPTGEIIASQTRHDYCAATGCPTRIFALNPEGSRRVLYQGDMRPIETPGDSVTDPARQNTDPAAHPFRVSRDGSRLRNFDLEIDLAPLVAR